MKMKYWIRFRPSDEPTLYVENDVAGYEISDKQMTIIHPPENTVARTTFALYGKLTKVEFSE
jgi:hypothetical protein